MQQGRALWFGKTTSRLVCCRLDGCHQTKAVGKTASPQRGGKESTASSVPFFEKRFDAGKLLGRLGRHQGIATAKRLGTTGKLNRLQFTRPVKCALPTFWTWGVRKSNPSFQVFPLGARPVPTAAIFPSHDESQEEHQYQVEQHQRKCRHWHKVYLGIATIGLLRLLHKYTLG